MNGSLSSAFWFARVLIRRGDTSQGYDFLDIKFTGLKFA